MRSEINDWKIWRGVSKRRAVSGGNVFWRKLLTGWPLIFLALSISGCASWCPAPVVKTEVKRQAIPEDLLPHLILPAWYPGGSNDAFVDYVERVSVKVQQHNATIDAAREANRASSAPAP